MLSASAQLKIPAGCDGWAGLLQNLRVYFHVFSFKSARVVQYQQNEALSLYRIFCIAIWTHSVQWQKYIKSTAPPLRILHNVIFPILHIVYISSAHPASFYGVFCNLNYYPCIKAIQLILYTHNVTSDHMDTLKTRPVGFASGKKSTCSVHKLIFSLAPSMIAWVCSPLFDNLSLVSPGLTIGTKEIYTNWM